MPSIKDKSTVEAIAREFCSNGRCKGKALAEIGYADSYALESGRGCEVVFSNVHVMSAIAKIDETEAEIGHRTIAGIDKMYQVAHDVALTCKQPAAAISAITGIARLYGMDKDADTGADSPDPLSEQELTWLRELAGRMPHLSKEAG